MIPMLPMLQTEVKEFLDWGHLPPLWVIFLVILPLVVGFSILIYRRERLTGGKRSRYLLAGLRAAAILAVLLFLFQPFMKKVTYRTRDPHLVILVDDSASFQIVDKYSNRDIPLKLAETLRLSPEVIERIGRYGLVKKLLEDPDIGFLDRLRRKLKVSLYTFAGGLRKIGEIPRSASGATGDLPVLPDLEKSQGEERIKQTKIGDSLLESLTDEREISFGGDDHGVVGMLLFSDGQNNAGVFQPEEAAVKLKQRGIPVLAVGVGNPDPPKNIRIVNLDMSDVVLVGDGVPFEAALIADGFEGERVQIDLLFDSEVVATEYVTLEGGGKKQLVRLEYRPQRPGDFTVGVKVEVLGGELFEEDNYFTRPIKVLDQKIKVLYVEGPPRWEYRYLKNALIRDKTMEAQILLLSADRDFRQESSPGIPPVTRFPETTDELFPYHVLIIGDVDPQGEDNVVQISGEQLELVHKFVSEAGGGVVFIAGENADPNQYLHTPLYPLLPVEVPETSRGYSPRRVITQTFNVKLTGAGKEHPILRLDSDPDRNAQLWENSDGIADNHLPGFYWFAEVNKVKPGAIALAVHPSLAHPIHGPRPILAVQNYGKGRTVFSAVDNTWRWRAGEDNKYFYRFWAQAIRFAASGRLLGKTPRFSLLTDKRLYTIGEKVTIEAKVFDANMKPATDPKLSIYHAIKGREGEGSTTIDLEQNPVKGPGSYEGSLTAGQLGSHDLWIGSENERLAFRTFTVEVPPLEFRSPQMDRERMKKVARLSEGNYYDLQEVMTALETLTRNVQPRQIPVDEKQDDVWDESWVLLLFTGLLTAEWILRKVVKLL